MLKLYIYELQICFKFCKILENKYVRCSILRNIFPLSLVKINGIYILNYLIFKKSYHELNLTFSLYSAKDISISAKFLIPANVFLMQFFIEIIYLFNFRYPWFFSVHSGAMYLKCAIICTQMCDTADGPAGWQSTVDAAAWQPQPGQKPEGRSRSREPGAAKDSPSRSEHNICPRGVWNSLERALAGPYVLRVCVCLMRTPVEEEEEGRRNCWAGAGAAADTRYEKQIRRT